VKLKRRGGFRGSWAGGEIYWKDLGEPEVPVDEGAPAKGNGASRVAGKRARRSKGPSGPTYYISKMVNGRRYKVSTGADNLKDALHELDRFMADPEGYRSPGERRPERALSILLNADTAAQFLTWSRDEKKNGPKWIHEQKVYLAWWQEVLGSVNLRELSVEQLLEALNGTKCRAPKIAVIKCLYGFLRKNGFQDEEGGVHRLAANEDPTLHHLTVPQAKAAQTRRSKVVPKEDFLAVLALTAQPYQDALKVLGACGWHTTELERFITDGSVDGDVLTVPRHKSGHAHRTRVSTEILDAAKRLRQNGPVGFWRLVGAVERACKAAGVKVFTPANLRHSVASWAVESGATIGQVGDYLGHRDPRTTARFYTTLAVPNKVPTIF
jgi:integrase